VDEPSCSTPRKRQIDLPSVESIEELRTPDYDELLKSFRESRGTWKQANGGSRHLPEAALEPLIGRN
jgi:kinesin family protein 11